MLVVACDPPICGGENTVYDERANLCICRPGAVEVDGRCVLLDAGPGDAGMPVPDAEVDSGTSACSPGDVRPCPGGNEIGECAAGEQACVGDGEWSACLGARGPAADVCDGRDEDCDGLVDEALATLGSPTIIDRFDDPAWQYLTQPIAAVPGVGGETIVVWSARQSQPGGEYARVFAQRVSATGSPVGTRLTLVQPGDFSERTTAYATATELVVVSAFQQDFDPAVISVSRFSLIDLSSIDSATIRRLPGSSFPSELAASPVDDTHTVIAIRLADQTHLVLAEVDPLPAAPATGALGEPVATGGGSGGGVFDLWYDSTMERAWIAFTDGPNVRVARITREGALAPDLLIEGGGQPVIRGANGTLGLAYLDAGGNARFVNLTAADPPVRGSGLDLGPTWSEPRRRTLAMTAYDSRSEWIVPLVRPFGGGVRRAALQQISFDGSRLAAQEIEITPPSTGSGGLAGSRPSESSSLVFVGGSALQAFAYGCP